MEFDEQPPFYKKRGVNMKIYAFDIGFEKFKNVGVWNGIYLHGTLQEEVGFDLVGCKRKPKKEGVYDVEVALPNGNVRNAILYYWKDTTNKDRGLVIDKFDIEEMHIYAFRRYRQKAEVI